MHIALTLFDGDHSPRTFRIEPTSPQAEKILVPRVLRTLRRAIGDNKVSTDVVTPMQYPTVPPEKAEKFENAYIALFLNPEAFRQVQEKPEHFHVIIKRFMPKDGG